MAQTRKRRQTKHRGNAAGMVENRGRTGRKPTENESKKQANSGRRPDRFSQPPSWKGSFQRALFAAAIFAVLAVLLLDRNPIQAIPLVVIMLGIYVPMGYYTDRWVYNRRQKKLAAQS